MKNDTMRRDTAKHYKAVHGILIKNSPLSMGSKPKQKDHPIALGFVGLTLITLAFTMISSCEHATPAVADTITIDHVAIDMKAIAFIESSNDPNKINVHSAAVGLYQITQICLDDYNLKHTYQYNLQDMMEPHKAYNVASWYLNIRIPQLLKHYHLTVDVDHILWAYNAGINKVRRGRMPEETKEYLIKYENYEERHGTKN